MYSVGQKAHEWTIKTKVALITLIITLIIINLLYNPDNPGNPGNPDRLFEGTGLNAEYLDNAPKDSDLASVQQTTVNPHNPMITLIMKIYIHSYDNPLINPR